MMRVVTAVGGGGGGGGAAVCRFEFRSVGPEGLAHGPLPLSLFLLLTGHLEGKAQLTDLMLQELTENLGEVEGINNNQSVN